MIHQNVKDIYYLLFQPLSKVLRPIYKLHYWAFRRATTKAHVGCGRHYLPGFINIDANFQRRADYLLDTRVGLPFPDNSMEFIYSCHMLEHVHINEAIKILKEWQRVLTPGGYIRLTLPDFEYIFQILAGRDECDFPRHFTGRQGKAINFLFCDGQHKFAYSKEVLEELAREIGFSAVVPAGKTDAHISNLSEIEPGGSVAVNILK
jgi:predicted SAM-dependent methyltransferase